jgi:hypothetical protein
MSTVDLKHPVFYTVTSSRIITINLAFLRTVENEDENTKELQRLQKIAFDVEKQYT